VTRKRTLPSTGALRFVLLSLALWLPFGALEAQEEAEANQACAASDPEECAQPAASPETGGGASNDAGSGSRIFGIIPNYRTSPSLEHYEPLTAPAKFSLARQDAFDRGTLVLAAVFAGDGAVTNSEPSFGHGAKGVGRYFGAAYADFVIGDFMTEAVFPSLLHQDPRYFRRGTGGVWSRLGYAVGQTFWTHADTGRGTFNYSEVLGTATGVAISNVYYPKNRNGSSAASKVSLQIGVDVAANVLKEFWPDLSGRLANPMRHRRRDPEQN
jgi:hypothetical protein